MPKRPPLPVSVALVLLWAAWVVVPPYLTWGAAITAAPFFGEQPSAAEQADADRLLAWAAALAVGLPALGVVLAVGFRARTGRWFHGIALALGAVGAAAVLAG